MGFHADRGRSSRDFDFQSGRAGRSALNAPFGFHSGFSDRAGRSSRDFAFHSGFVGRSVPNAPLGFHSVRPGRSSRDFDFHSGFAGRSVLNGPLGFHSGFSDRGGRSSRDFDFQSGRAGRSDVNELFGFQSALAGRSGLNSPFGFHSGPSDFLGGAGVNSPFGFQPSLPDESRSSRGALGRGASFDSRRPPDPAGRHSFMPSRLRNPLWRSSPRRPISPRASMASCASSRESHNFPFCHHFISAVGLFCFSRLNVGISSSFEPARKAVGWLSTRIVQYA